MSQQLVTTREDGSEPELKEVQVLLYKEKVDGPLGTYLSMRDIKASGPLAALCAVLAGALGAGWEWRSGCCGRDHMQRVGGSVARQLCLHPLP